MGSRGEPGLPGAMGPPGPQGPNGLSLPGSPVCLLEITSQHWHDFYLVSPADVLVKTWLQS